MHDGKIGDRGLPLRAQSQALLDGTVQRFELGCDLAFDLDQIGEPRLGHARGLQTLGHGGEFIQPLNEPLLFLDPLLFVAARNERRSRRRDLGALFGEAERGRHADDALRGDPRHRSVDVGEGVPRDRAGADGQHGHAAERQEQFGLDA